MSTTLFPYKTLFRSNEDKSITDRLKNAGELLGIKVLDHIIIGYDGDYYSFKENELI